MREQDSCSKKNRECNGKRRCYAVKVCIEKSPNPACTKGSIKVDPTCRVVKKRLPACDPPPAYPPSQPCYNHVQYPPDRPCCTAAPHHPHLPCQRVPPTCKKYPQKQHQPNCQDNMCQTTTPRPVPPCEKIEKDIQCSNWLIDKCPTQDSACQTACKEMKHCGNQISPCGKQCTKDCQTELDSSCGAVGVEHNRKVCNKPCCKRANEKRDAVCQPHSATTTRHSPKKSNNCRVAKKGKCEQTRSRPETAALEQYKFPFVGRTPSGNLKVRPCMVIAFTHAVNSAMIYIPCIITKESG